MSWNTPAREKFLRAVHPAFAVISVGADNDYGHPAKKTLSRLEAQDIQILRTDLSGTITAYSTPDKPFFCPARTLPLIEFLSFSPLCEQLSIETTASGALHVLNLSNKSAATTAIADTALSGPLSISLWINGKNAPFASRRAYPFSVIVNEII